MKRGVALLVLASGCATATPGSEDSPIIRLSLPTKEDYESWNEMGFRLQLGYGPGRLFGADDLPSSTVHAMSVRGGVRLNLDWSLYAHLRYEIADGETDGLRYVGTIEPTYHITDGFTLSLGLGIGGLIVDTLEPAEMTAGRPGPPRTRVDTTPALDSCTGTGVVATARLEYNIVLGSLFSMGPAAWSDVQYTACVDEIDGVDPETGGPSQVRQYWRHHSASLGWMFSWR